MKDQTVREFIDQVDFIRYMHRDGCIFVSRPLMEEYGMDGGYLLTQAAKDNLKVLKRQGVDFSIPWQLERLNTMFLRKDGGAPAVIPALHYLFFKGEVYVATKPILPYNK